MTLHKQISKYIIDEVLTPALMNVCMWCNLITFAGEPPADDRRGGAAGLLLHAVRHQGRRPPTTAAATAAVTEMFPHSGQVEVCYNVQSTVAAMAEHPNLNKQKNCPRELMANTVLVPCGKLVSIRSYLRKCREVFASLILCCLFKRYFFHPHTNSGTRFGII